MLKKLLGVLIVTSQIATTAYGSNDKLLELEADAYTSKIWSGVPVSKDSIKESLSFLYDKEMVDEKYSNPIKIELLEKENQDLQFINFSKNCQSIYEEGEDITKISVNMLFQRVSEKYLKDLHKFDRLKAFKEKEKQIQSESMFNIGNMLDIFANADKGINIK
jgi:hypothetical protein